MILKEIINNVKIESLIGNDSVEVNGIEFDSRKIVAGTMFVAMRGTVVDGHDFIEKAQEMGAIVVVCEKLPKQMKESLTYVQVKDSTFALGLLASNFYGNPSQNMQVVGVTGTNGKTTIATVLYDLFRSLGEKVGLFSTVCNYIDGEAYPTDHTTPDALEINKLMAEMYSRGVKYVFMEVSSHSVVQHRINGLHFVGGIFTNLTRDHLDYHKTFKAYLEAKKLFFDNYLDKKAFALTNIDDKNGNVMLQNTQAKKYSYSLLQQADYKVKVVEECFDGMQLEINGKEVWVPFIGRFNALNLTAIAGTANLLGVDFYKVLIALSAMKPVSGRFEPIVSNDGKIAIVDYAHTPDALDNVLSTINEIRNGKNNLITIVGCGGNRDKGKRPMMAKSAVSASDKVIVTSDNPRNEKPEDIINDMLEGLTDKEKKKVLTIIDRREAIKTAVFLAQPGDVILIAGKGHEDYQIIGTEKLHFSDQEEVMKFFEN